MTKKPLSKPSQTRLSEKVPKSSRPTRFEEKANSLKARSVRLSEFCPERK